MADDQLHSTSERNQAMTLWSDAATTRQFLIPDAWDATPGQYLLRSTTGQERWVNSAAVAQFEVSGQEAEDWLKDQLRQVVKKLGAGLCDTLLGPEPAVAERAPGASAIAGGEAPSTTPGLDLLADITGTPRDGLTDDYAAIGRALRGYFGDLTATVGDALGGDPERMAAAQARMDQWAQTLREHGVAAPSTPADPVAEAPTDPAARPSSGVSAPGALDRADTLGVAGAAGIAERLRQLADDLRRRADALADARQAARPDPDHPDRDT